MDKEKRGYIEAYYGDLAIGYIEDMIKELEIIKDSLTTDAYYFRKIYWERQLIYFRVAEYGNVETFEISSEKLEVKITDDFSTNMRMTLDLMKMLIDFAEPYKLVSVQKMITDDNLFHLILD